MPEGMVEELVIVRHAEALPGEPGSPDADRPLSAAGEQAADEVGRWISSMGAVDRVICSPALRARESARRICKGSGCSFEEVRWVDRVYGASVPVLVQIVEEQGQGALRVLLVGHNPGLVGLLRHVLGRGAPGRFPPGAAVRVRFDGPMRERGSGGFVDAWFPGD